MMYGILIASCLLLSLAWTEYRLRQITQRLIDRGLLRERLHELQHRDVELIQPLEPRLSDRFAPAAV